MHETKSPHAGKTVMTPLGPFRVEDYYDRVFIGHDIRREHGSVVANEYQARRAASPEIPDDGEVLYGKIGIVTHAVHVSEVTDAGAHPSKYVDAHEDVNEAKTETADEPEAEDGGPDGGKSTE